MYLVDDLDNQKTLKEVVLDTCNNLSIKKKLKLHFESEIII